MVLEQLAAAARQVDGRVGLELQWALPEDDEDCGWQLALHVVVERPGPHHGRYSTVELARFAAEEIEQRQAAHRSALDVATLADLRVLYMPAIEDRGGQGGSEWIRGQPAVEHTYALEWEARWWTDDGEPVSRSGVDHVTAPSGYDADVVLSRALATRFPARPLSMQITGGMARPSGGVTGASWPERLPSIDRVRDISLAEGCRASGIARGLVARVPDVTALELMLAFEHAFHLWFERLRPLAGWRRGEIDDAALDAAISVEISRERWDRPRRLREARAGGQNIARFMRDELRNMQNGGVVELVIALREEFDLPLGVAKCFVDDCRDARNDERLDALLRQPRR